MPSTIQGDEGINPIVVAIDKDKHSSSAVKWAVDHLVISNPALVLVHVRMKNSPNRRYPPPFECTHLWCKPSPAPPHIEY